MILASGARVGMGLDKLYCVHGRPACEATDAACQTLGRLRSDPDGCIARGVRSFSSAFARGRGRAASPTLRIQCRGREREAHQKRGRETVVLHTDGP